jgi:transporter family-2 protein
VWIESGSPKFAFDCRIVVRGSGEMRAGDDEVLPHPTAMSFLAYLIAIASGAANPLQSGANAELNKQIASPLWAGIFVYATGLLGLLLAQLILRQAFPATDRLLTVKAWAWLGGLISIASTLAGLTLAQRLGSGVFTGLTVTASIVTSVLLDHLGWVGFRQHSASPARLAGCTLMVIGLWMVAKF